MHTIFRAEKDKTSPDSYLLKKIADYFNVSVDELLNGPQEKQFTVILKVAKSIEEVEEEMIRDKFSLTVTEDGYVGASGLAMLNDEKDIQDALAKIRLNLEEGFKTKRRMEERRKL
jgi:transcriptional regulator with XRE-family HTH domain